MSVPLTQAYLIGRGRQPIEAILPLAPHTTEHPTGKKPTYNQKHADTPNQTKRYTRAYIKTHIQIQENGKLKVQLQTWKESLFSANHGAAICTILENAVF